MQKYKTLLIVLVLLVGLFFVGEFMMYGSLVRSCAYTQEIMNVPKDIKRGYFVTVKNASLVTIDEGYGCAPYFKNREITYMMGQGEMREFGGSFIRKGAQIQTIPEGKRFKMVDIVWFVKHGITTMDSGSGPDKFYIVEDEAGKRYSLFVPVNNEDYFVLFYASSTAEGLPVHYRNFHGVLNSLL